MPPVSHEAIHAETTPLARGGNSFASHRPVITASRLYWRPTLRVWALGALFAVPASLVLLALLVAGEVQLDDPASWILPLIATLFVGLGVLIVRRNYVPIIFDRNLGWFWRGRPQAKGSASIAALKESASLADIVALQLISGQKMHSPYASWDTWELNLILNTGQRLPVIHHGNLKILRQDAASLANWLGLPLVE